jgi:hypothetical protein
MSFHKKILLTFLIYHLIFTFGVLLAEYLVALTGEYDEYGVDFSVVVVIHIFLMLTISVGLTVLAYGLRYLLQRIKHQK